MATLRKMSSMKFAKKKCNSLFISEFNESLLTKLPGDVHTYYSVDCVDMNEDGTDHIPQEVLRSQTPSVLPPSGLNLEVVAPIILLHNLYPASGECNGTRMVITRLGRRCLIPRNQLKTTESDLPYILNQRHYSFRLCFTMTVNNSQGQSLKTVGG